MELTKVSVPGKVMLSGEYAVLYGAVSVLTTVPRYIELTEMNVPPETPYSPVVKAAIQHPIPDIIDYEQANGLPHIDLDCSQFFSRDKSGREIKLGLGCSAAEAVGVISLRYERAGRRMAGHKDAILGHAVQAHSRAQSGLGSGADVAACAYGTPIKFRKSGNDFRLDAIDIDKSSPIITMNLVWTGQSADTRKMVGQFQNWVEYGGTKSRDLIAKLIEASNELADAWFSTSQENLFNLIDNFDSAMNVCAEQSGIQYKIELHEEIEAWAVNHGGRTKPTGAGGGDMILLLGDLPVDQLDRLVIPLSI